MGECPYQSEDPFTPGLSPSLKQQEYCTMPCKAGRGNWAMSWSIARLCKPLVCLVLWTQKTWTAKPAKRVNTGWGFSDMSTVFHMAHRSCGLVSRSQGRLSSCSPTWLLADGGTRQPHPDWAMRGEKLALPVQQTKCLGEVFYKGAY